MPEGLCGVGSVGAVADPFFSAGALAPDPRNPQQRQKSLTVLDWVTVQESVTVQEGLCVSVACNVSYRHLGWTESDPAYGFWFREGAVRNQAALVATNKGDHKVQEWAQGRFLLHGDPGNYSCSLDIRDARKTDSGSYYFRVERGPTLKYSFLQNKLTVSVTGKERSPGEATGEV